MTERTCTYQFDSGETCKEPAYGNSPFCILHVDFPDETAPEDEVEEVRQKKKKRVEEKISSGDFDFEGAKIYSIDCNGKEIITFLSFRGATIKEGAQFEEATINAGAQFEEATFEGIATFAGAKFKVEARFDGATFERDAKFDGVTFEWGASFAGAGATFKKDASFNEAKFEGIATFAGATFEWGASFYYAWFGLDAWFNEAKFEGILTATFTGATFERDAWFNEAKFEGCAQFEEVKIKKDASFYGATIRRDFTCQTAEIKGKLSFENTTFTRIESQEEACRKAKQVWENLGDREKADDYFYKEMVAKRKQKPWLNRLIELPLQYVIWYWVYPVRVFCSFIGFFLAFGLLFWFVGGNLTFDEFISKLQASFFALFNPVSAIQNAQHGLIGTLTVIAGFIGLFTWPVFIASLAKKYGR